MIKIIEGPEGIQGSEPWLALRRGLVTASEVSAVLGLSPWDTRESLLHKKINNVASEYKEVFEIGKQTEIDIRQFFEAKMKFPLYQHVLINDKYPFLLASFDGINLDEKFAIEAKYLSREKFLNVGKNIVPENYMPQIQTQLLIAELDGIFFAGKCPAKLKNEAEENPIYSGIKYCHVEADKAMQDKILIEAERFYKELTGAM